MPNYKLDKKVFSTGDLSAILLGLSSISSMIHCDEQINALEKIKSFIPADRAKEIELKSSQIHIDLNSWMGNKNIQAHLKIIKEALQERKILSFDYADRHGDKTTRTVEPYQLVLKNSHWYCQGYCLKRNDFRLFKLSRMSNLEMQATTFEARDYQRPQLEFTDILTTMQKQIKIRIQQSIMDDLLDYCAYEDFLPAGEEHYIVNFPFIENNYYYNILLGFGNKCECLEPLTVRTEMKRRIQELAAIYED
ncbi:putative DNA-binding transcriptional regulator YafY [Enterococcus sp. PF1-24]|uniref:helix-turn-helix transcriptional regulator n=1 Tax=unclassified Enterococcus TaxID=2608891 RepID=UPI00247D4A7E|nr:putative DNA-binding transcriptional regulator YafY [Enterococcus sp. PFB1-1]MDH6401502.1 putative DNA-binding transcriptional regulator YafY [Enterococcus sp. PF1-24]